MGLFGASKGSAEHDPDTALDVPLTESAHEGGPHSPGHQHEHEQEQEQGRVAVPVSRSGGKFHYEPQEAGAHKGRDEGEDEDLEELDLDTEKALHIEPGTKGDLYSGQSEIEQVALTVPVEDDPSLPVWTFRMWFMGIISCAFLSFINQFFSYRRAPLGVSAVTAQLVTLYVGRFMAAVIPKSWTLLNPGPFNIKEHVLITIFAGTGAAGAYAVDIVTLTNSPAFYNSYMPFAAAIVITITTQVLGYGWAGLFRRYLVDPAPMWWPSTLVSTTLFHTMHDEDRPEPGQMGRFTFFLIVTACSFFYYALPGYLFTALASFAWVCWVWPNSIVAQQIGSGYSGMGIGAVSLDWATAVAFNGSPLATPWYVIVNVFVGFTLFMWVGQPFLYWFNVYNARNFEFFGSELFNPDGTPYDVSLVVDPATLSLNETAYEIYGPPNLSVFFAFTYGVSFAALAAMIVHVILWNGKDILNQTLTAAKAKDMDVHTRIMKHNYRDCPEWWFVLLGGACLALSIVATIVWQDTLQLPWWGIILAAVFAGSLTLPIGIICATTNQAPGLNVVTEMIMGYLLPGKPVANVLFKTYGYISSVQAISFLSDFKLGLYMKIPPRSMFLVQLLATLIAACVTLSTAWWQLTTIPYICDIQNLPPGSPWTCPGAHVFFDASVIWGLIGPARIFGAEGKYSAQNWWWLVGAVLPVPFWFFYKYVTPNQKWLRLVNIPILLGAGAIAPPAGTINFTAWFVWGFVFEYYLFNYRKRIWARYNYLFSAGMETGIAFMGLLLFFAFQNPGIYLDWWGNNPECPIVTCPTTNSASLALNAAGGNIYTGEACPVWY